MNCTQNQQTVVQIKSEPPPDANYPPVRVGAKCGTPYCCCCAHGEGSEHVCARMPAQERGATLRRSTVFGNKAQARSSQAL